MSKARDVRSVFNTDDEPYLGRVSVFEFDKVIVTVLDSNTKIAACTHKYKNQLTGLQLAACQIVPQGINLALSIRELVRQGYLFAAIVLLRPLIERAAIISYLEAYPDQVSLWKDGWQFKKRPSLAMMLDTMAGEESIEAKEICDLFNHIIHGDPVGSSWNIVDLGAGGLGYSAGKVLNSPDLCNFICFQSYCYLLVLNARASIVFSSLLD